VVSPLLQHEEESGLRGSNASIEYFGAEEMGESERRDFLSWYAERKDEVFDNRRVLERYCQYDVTVLREACQLF
jgi:predicted esterase YcpF (UPF0227 family)